jgi:hypothetical protein
MNIIVILLIWTAEKVAEKALEKLLDEILSAHYVKRLTNSFKLQILVLYLDWLLQKTPLRDLPEQRNLDAEPEQLENSGE